MMKRVVAILCLAVFCVVAMAETVTHNFHESKRNEKLTWKQTNGVYDYTIGYIDDGTVYTCKDGASFSVVTISGTSTYCIALEQNDSVIVSPARMGLTELGIYYAENTANMAISVSTDSITWTPIETIGTRSTPFKGKILVNSFRGNYFISIKNLAASKVNIIEIDYVISAALVPACDNCFPVVLE